MKEFFRKAFSNEYRFTSLLIFGLVVIGAIFILIFAPYVGQFLFEHKVKVEDRSFWQQKQEIALNRYHLCEDKVEKNYSANWKEACKILHSDQLASCNNAGVPSSICESRFTFHEDCGLSDARTARVEAFRIEAKQECLTDYNLETKEIGQ